MHAPFKMLIAGAACFLFVGVALADSTVIITGDTSAGENQPGWMFNRDSSTATPFEFTADEASIGLGSLFVLPIGSNSSDKFIGENFLNALIADVDSVSYDFMLGDGSDGEEEHFYMNVYANFGESADDKFYDCRYNVIPTTGSTAGFTTVTFDPTASYPVTTRGGANASPYACPSSPADMDLLSPGSNIRAFALNVGDTSSNDEGVSGYLDNVVVDLDGNAITYDFEPYVVATDKNQCKKGGWMSVTDADGNGFKNQGQCVAYTVSAR